MPRSTSDNDHREWEGVESAIERQLRGYRLATVEILYHMPDHPGVLQSYVWQDYDLAPHYPVLRAFLDFWRENLDGPLHSVRLCTKALITPARWRHAAGVLTIQ